MGQQHAAAEALRRLRWGFALSGGGAKGAYTAGVMVGLQEAGVLTAELDGVKVLTGVSTGALVAAAVATGDFEALRRVYTTVTTSQVIRASRPAVRRALGLKGQLAFNALFGPPYLYDTAPLRALVREHVGPDGFRTMLARKSLLDVAFVSVDLASGNVVSIGNQTPDVGVAELEDALLASTNQPVLMDLVDIGGHLHGDGGLRDFLPAHQLLRSPFAHQLDVIVTVPLDTGDGPRSTPNPTKLLAVLERTVGILSYEVGDSDQLSTELVDAIVRLRRAVGEDAWQALVPSFSPRVQDLLGRLRAPDATFQFLEIRPSRMPVTDSLAFVPEEMTEAFELGREEGVAAIGRWYETEGRAYVAERGLA